jgi:5-formyltetrahydrofolate cyclo-ligase
MSETVPQRKTRLRAELLERRRSLEGGADRLWTNVVVELAGRDRLGPGRTVMAFHAFGDEPPTTTLFEGIWAAGADLVLPRVDAGAIVPVRYRRSEPLVPSSYGVPEPTGPGLDPHSMTTVIVPGLAFDRSGHRIGYGAGYYDRFLSTLSEACLLVGACLHPLLVAELPAEDHDVAVDVVVTDEEVARPG